MDTAKLSRLVGKIYEGAMDEAAWRTFMEELRKELGASHSLMFTPYIDPTEETGLWASESLLREDLQDYFDHYHAKDIWFQGGYERNIVKSGRVYTGEDLVDEGVFENSEIYNEWAREREIKTLLGSTVFYGEEYRGVPTVIMGVYGGNNSTFFDKEAVRQCRLLVPHVQRSLMLHRKVKTAGLQGFVVEGLLESASKPAFLIDGDGKVVEMNALGENLLRGDDFLLVHGRLRTTSRLHGNMLDTLIHDTIGTAREYPPVERSTKRDFSCMIPHPTSTRPYIASIYPLPAHYVAFCRPISAVLYIDHPSTYAKPYLELIADFYGLTKAESRLCSLLAKGHMLKQACDHLGIAEGTGRQTLKSIFRKTGTGSQTQLARMIASYA